jgi:hypothetical protein
MGIELPTCKGLPDYHFSYVSASLKGGNSSQLKQNYDFFARFALLFDKVYFHGVISRICG